MTTKKEKDTLAEELQACKAKMEKLRKIIKLQAITLKALETDNEALVHLLANLTQSDSNKSSCNDVQKL